MIELTCLRCGHIWIPRQDNPERCPKCKSYRWNTKKKKDIDLSIFDDLDGPELVTKATELFKNATQKDRETINQYLFDRALKENK